MAVEHRTHEKIYTDQPCARALVKRTESKRSDEKK